VRRAERASELQLVVGHVDGYQGERTGQSTALHCVQSDATHAEDRQARAGRHAGGVYDSPCAGRDRAPDQGRFVERHIIADLDSAV
jgi:hypothetical protein